MDNILDVSHLNFQYNKERAIILDCNLKIKKGTITSFIGLSGCGKTTLLNLIAGFIKPSSGKIIFQDKEIVGPSAERCMVFQEDAIFPWYTVKENIEYSLSIKNKKDDKEVTKLLNAVGLDGFQNFFPKEISGGMKKRVDLARAFVANPQLLLMDEPFGALDAMTRQKMQNLFLSLWNEEQNTIIIVTHDIAEAIYLSDTIYLMENKEGNISKEYSVPFQRQRKPVIKKSAEFLDLLTTIENDINRIEQA